MERSVPAFKNKFFYIFHVLKECILTFFLKLDQTHEQKFSSILSK